MTALGTPGPSGPARYRELKAVFRDGTARVLGHAYNDPHGRERLRREALAVLAWPNVASVTTYPCDRIASVNGKGRYR